MNDAKLITVFLVVLVDLLGFGIVLPLLPFYASKFNASPLSIGFLYSIYSLAQLVFSPIWGSWSDRIGRRPIMLMSTFGASLAYLLFAFSGSFTLLFVSRLAAGVMGGNISTAQAYVADVTTPENRAKGMGLIGAAFGIGFALGPAIAAVCITRSERLPGIVAAALSFCSFLLVCFLLPESVIASEAKQSDANRSSQPPAAPRNDTARVQKISVFNPAFWFFLNEKKGFLMTFLLCYLFISIGHSSLYSSFPLFCKKILNMPPDKVGMLFVWTGTIAVLIQGGMIRLLVKKFGEKKLFFAGNVLMVTGLFLIPWAGSERTLILFLAVLAVGGSLNGPTLTSLISKEAEPSRLGYTMGTAQGLSALGRVIGPAWGGFLFGIMPTLPFLATAALLAWTIWVGFEIIRAL